MKALNAITIFLYLFLSIYLFSCSGEKENQIKEDYNCFDTIFKNDSILICISSSLIVADSMGVKISINGNEKQFNIDRYYRSIWKDTIVYPYIFLNASCGTECLTKFILNFNTGDSFEYLFFYRY